MATVAGLAFATDERGVTTVTLTREAAHNALDEALIEALTAAFEQAAHAAQTRVVVLRARGKSFCAGADLGWMRRAADDGEAENLADARRLAAMLQAIDRCPKPVVAVVHGAALGGGVGLVATSDIALAADTAVFALSEVRLGLIPATIGPYVVAAIGARACRRLFLTAERFDAALALRLGLVHEVVPAGALDGALDRELDALLAGAPGAQTAAKDLIRSVAGRPIDDDLIEDTAGRIARQRAGAEAAEGIAAFFAKRAPAWRR